MMIIVGSVVLFPMCTCGLLTLYRIVRQWWERESERQRQSQRGQGTEHRERHRLRQHTHTQTLETPSSISSPQHYEENTLAADNSSRERQQSLGDTRMPAANIETRSPEIGFTHGATEYVPTPRADTMSSRERDVFMEL